jgi:hypothetical protein
MLGWLAAGSTAIRDNSMIQPKRTIRKLRSLAEPKMDMKVRTSQENSTPKSVEASRAVEIRCLRSNFDSFRFGSHLESLKLVGT